LRFIVSSLQELAAVFQRWYPDLPLEEPQVA
jgi:hypothetical protein